MLLQGDINETPKGNFREDLTTYLNNITIIITFTRNSDHTEIDKTTKDFLQSIEEFCEARGRF